MVAPFSGLLGSASVQDSRFARLGAWMRWMIQLLAATHDVDSVAATEAAKLVDHCNAGDRDVAGFRRRDWPGCFVYPQTRLQRHCTSPGRQELYVVFPKCILWSCT